MHIKNLILKIQSLYPVGIWKIQNCLLFLFVISVLNVSAQDTIKITQKEANLLISPMRTNDFIYDFTKCFFNDAEVANCKGWVQFPKVGLTDFTYAYQNVQNEGTLTDPGYVFNLNNRKFSMTANWKPKAFKTNKNTPVVLEYELNELLQPVTLNVIIILGKRKMIASISLFEVENKKVVSDFIQSTPAYQQSDFVRINKNKLDSARQAEEQIAIRKRAYEDSLLTEKKKAEEAIRLAQKKQQDSIIQVQKINEAKKKAYQDSMLLVKKKADEALQLEQKKKQDSLLQVQKINEEKKKAYQDSVAIEKKKADEIIRLAQKKQQDSLLQVQKISEAKRKAFQDSMLLEKKKSDEALLLAQKKREDSIRLSKQKIADSILLSKKIADSIQRRKQRIADSIANLKKTKKPIYQKIATGVIRDIDGYEYQTYRIGGQTWMAANLNVTRFRNGDPIMEAQNREEWKQADLDGIPAWCYYLEDAENAVKFGKLYNWHAVRDPRGLAPEKWHIPTMEEWNRMLDFLGGAEKAGALLKDTTGWTAKGNGNNLTGFTAKPGGSRDYSGSFKGRSSFGYWWMNEEHGAETGWGIDMGYTYNKVTVFAFRKGNGFAVRCLRD